MEITGRLTHTHPSGGNWSLKGLPWSALTAGKTIDENTRQLLYGALCKLKAYEDTGLSPEAIEQLLWERETAD